MIQVNRRKGLALVIYLAITQQRHTRISLATLLWAESSQASALASLRTTLADLRKSLLKPYIIIQKDTIHIDNIDVDVLRFRSDVQTIKRLSEQAEDAMWIQSVLDQYQDDFLAGFIVPHCEEFERWQHIERTQLITLRLEIIRYLTDFFLKCGNTNQAIHYAEKHIVLDPLDETPYRTLMNLYGQIGKRTTAIKIYEKLHELLDRELAITPDKASQTIYESILNNIEPRTKTPPTIMMSPTIRGKWVGRHNALDKVKRLIANRTQRIVIQGAPGIGKSTFARKIAQTSYITDIFPDGVMWSTLGENPNIYSELALWCSVLDQSIHPHFDLHMIKRELSTHFQNRQMLLIIDDVWHVEDYLPFQIGGRNCVHLITTQQYDIALKIAETPDAVIQLHGLEEEEAIELFKHLAPTIPEKFFVQVERLQAKLGYSPLAIRVVARLLDYEAQLGLDIETALTALDKNELLFDSSIPLDRYDIDNQSLETIADIFERSTNTLDQSTAEFFFQLAVLAIDSRGFDLPAMISIWGITNVRPVVRQLVNRGLIEVLGNGRFTIHALLHKFIKFKQSGDIAEAGRRHAIHYLELLSQADVLYRSYPDRLPEALRLVDQILHQLVYAQQWIIRTNASYLLNKYIDTGHDLLKLRIPPIELLEIYEQYLLIVEDENDTNILGKCLYLIGLFAARTFQMERARNALNRSISIAKILHDQNLQANSLQELGYISFFTNDYQLARQHFQECIELWTKLNDQRGVAYCLNKLGRIAWRCGDYDQASLYLQESLVSWTALGDQYGRAECLNDLGNVYGILGLQTYSKKYHLENLEVRKKLHDERGVGEAMNNLGAVYWREENYQDAAQCYYDSLNIHKRLGNTQGIVLGLINLGRFELQNRRLENAINYFEQSRNICREKDIRHWHSYTLGKIGYIAYLEGKFTAATESYALAATIASEIKSSALSLEILAGYIILYSAINKEKTPDKFINTILYHKATYDETKKTIQSHFINQMPMEELDELIQPEEAIKWILLETDRYKDKHKPKS